jgi:carboxymethylenebutenolidase
MPLSADHSKDFDALHPGIGTRAPGASPHRRDALKFAVGAALGVGYAAAAGPLSAQTVVRTPADGLVAGPVRFDVGGFQVPAYRAAPAGRTGLPVILVVHEIWGVHEYIADVVRRLARAGYLAIAPDLFARQGDASSYTDTGRLLSELVARVPDAQVLEDLDGALRWAGTQGGDTTRAGITGFCWGGRMVWLQAAQANLKAGVAWYGRLVGAANERTPRHPVDVAAQLKVPVLGLYGGQDAGIPLDTVDKMKAQLSAGSAAAKASQFVVYPEAGHAFHADYRPTFRAAPAEDGWTRALAWFKTYGVT